MKTKSEIAQLVASGRAHECFTHETTGTYDVTLMREAALAGLYGLPFRADLTHDIVENIKRMRDWEQERVLALTDEQMSEPSLWVLLPGNEHLLIDGTHRLLARATAGLTDFIGFMAPWSRTIRPNQLLFNNPKHDWGKVEVRDGKLYDRETGKLWRTPS